MGIELRNFICTPSGVGRMIGGLTLFSSLPSALTEAIDQLLAHKDTVLVGLDGMSCAGKSTLAGALSRHYGCPVVHMDDFFLPPELRTPERFAQPGGNVHYERVLAQVLRPLSRGEHTVYDRFNCHSLTYTDQISLSPAPLIIVEGAYALHPALRAYYDLRVLCPVEPEVQLQRVLQRNGPQGLAAFRDKWIPLENRYLEQCEVATCCDLILSATNSL